MKFWEEVSEVRSDPEIGRKEMCINRVVRCCEHICHWPKPNNSHATKGMVKEENQTCLQFSAST